MQLKQCCHSKCLWTCQTWLHISHATLFCSRNKWSRCPYLHHQNHCVTHNKREDEVLECLRRHHTPYMELETIVGNVPPQGFGFESKLDTLALMK